MERQPTKEKPASRAQLLAAVLVIVALGMVLLAMVTRASPVLGSTGRIQLNSPGAAFVEASTDDRGIDPGYEKDVATCTAVILGTDTVAIDITNAYPSYTCVFSVTIENTGETPLRRATPVISAPPELTVTTEDRPCGDLNPGETDIETFALHVEQVAAQEATYQFTIAKRFLEADPGTIGFWGNWDSHRSFSAEQIEGWLSEIDETSGWLGPVTTDGMEDLFAGGRGRGATPESRFLTHYLATRLNQRAGLLCSTVPHDVSDLDRDGYLGLADPQTATLGQIIGAIEAKAGTSPTRQQFDLMKTICDELNNAAR